MFFWLSLFAVMLIVSYVPCFFLTSYVAMAIASDREGIMLICLLITPLLAVAMATWATNRITSKLFERNRNTKKKYDS
jgi:hypothetical protein